MTRYDTVNVLVDPRMKDVHSSASDVSRLVIEVNIQEVFFGVKRLINKRGVNEYYEIGTVKDMLTSRVRSTVHPVTAYLEDRGISYELNLPQGVVYIPRAESMLRADMEERFSLIIKGTRVLPDGETFQQKNDFDGVKLY